NVVKRLRDQQDVARFVVDRSSAGSGRSMKLGGAPDERFNVATVSLYLVSDARYELADALELLLLEGSRSARLPRERARWLGVGSQRARIAWLRRDGARCLRVGSQRARRGFSALTSGAGRERFFGVDRG